MQHDDSLVLEQQRNKLTLIVVEPNARGVGGHYLDYVLSFVGALDAINVRTKMLASRQLDAAMRSDFLVPTFTFGFWDAYPPHVETDRSLAKLCYRLLHRPAVRLYYHPKTLPWRRHRRRSLKGLAGRLLSLPMRALNVLNDRAVPLETALKHRMRTWSVQRRVVRTSLRELQDALAKLNVTNPVLFFTTAGEHELEVAQRLLARQPTASAILMLRRPPFFLFEGQDVDAAIEAARRGALIDRIRVTPQKLIERIQYVTDTQELASLFSLLSGAAFHIMPIPHIVAQAPKREAGTIRLAYLGDARTEKGFLELPAIAAALDRSPCRDSVRLFVQCNLNIPGGEPGICDAIQVLRNTYGHFVELHDRPLDRDAYAARMASADLLLLPYDRDLYRHRSSGIVVEALSAGATPIVPTGSWLDKACRQIVAEDRARDRKQFKELYRFNLSDHQRPPAPTATAPVAQLQDVRAGRVLAGGEYHLAGHSVGEIRFRLSDSPCDGLEISFSTLLLQEEHIFDLEVVFLDHAGNALRTIRRQRHLYRASPALAPESDPDRFVDLLPVPPGAASLVLRWHNNYAGRDLIVSDLTLTFLRRTGAAAAHPRGALVYGSSDELIELIIDEVGRRLQATGDRFRSWPGTVFHNPETFSRKLMAVIGRCATQTVLS